MQVRPNWFSLSIIPVLFLAGCTAGESAQEPSGPAAIVNVGDDVIPDAGSIRGVVVDDSNAPLEGVLALVQELKAQAQTDAGGEFTFQNVPPGKYTVYVSKLGFESRGKSIDVVANEMTTVTLLLSPIPIAEPYFETQMRVVEIIVGFSWAVGGDFNQGCLVPGVTCQGAAVSTLNPVNGPNFRFLIDDPKVTPMATIVHEQTWVPNSAVCAKAVQVGIYNPDAPSIGNPSSSNPHYWTNYPHPEFKITSPIWMRIPRNETGNADAVDGPDRVEKNKGDFMKVKGNWTVRDFPPGKGLTNLPADGNCFTQQKIDLFWTTFFLEASPVDFSARPDA